MPTTPPDGALPSLPAAPGAAAPGQGGRRPEVTELLRAWAAGDAQATDSLVRLVYAELRRQARLALRREGGPQTLQPTALVHEAWLRLGEQHEARWESRTQFFAVAAQMMRRVLLDHVRARRARKRGGGVVQVSLVDVGAAAEAPLDAIDVIALDEALTRLASLDPRKARMVELRYFTGLSIPEAAAVLGVSTATVTREWAVARMWLRRELDA